MRRYFFTLVAVVFILCARVDAQTGGVTLTASVSETVALSIAGPIPPNFTRSDVDIDVVSSGRNTVEITVSSVEATSSVIRVPLLVRSNTGFKILAMFESNTALIDQLSVTDVHATGALSSANLVNALEATRLNELDVSRPLLVLRGPRVSLGGALESPNNALQFTLLIHLKPQPGPVSPVHLKLAATAVPLIQ